jgi:hypothetical protein
LSEKRPDVTVVAYPPIIDAKPNDMATVYTAMKKCLDMTNEAGQEHLGMLYKHSTSNFMLLPNR